jgi:uncharacterized membrane protein YjgN (DUF898 family)
MVPAAPAAPAGTGTARFVGNEAHYWRLMIRGAVLLLFTLGIYRFWLATDQRRFLWANTEIAGDALEYAGTARELLVGFLVAIAVLVPIYAVSSLPRSMPGFSARCRARWPSWCSPCSRISRSTARAAIA